MWIPWTSFLPQHKGEQQRKAVLFHASFAHKMRRKIHKKTKPRIQNSEPKEYSNPLGVNIFKVQLTGLKTQYALNNLHRKFHSGLVSCCFVSGVSTMVSGNIKFLAGHERAMLVIVMWKLGLCCSSICWLQRGSSSISREHDPWQQYCFQKSQEKAVSTMNYQIFLRHQAPLCPLFLSRILLTSSPISAALFHISSSIIKKWSLSCCKAYTSPTGS